MWDADSLFGHDVISLILKIYWKKKKNDDPNFDPYDLQVLWWRPTTSVTVLLRCHCGATVKAAVTSGRTVWDCNACSPTTPACVSLSKLCTRFIYRSQQSGWDEFDLFICCWLSLKLSWLCDDILIRFHTVNDFCVTVSAVFIVDGLMDV